MSMGKYNSKYIDERIGLMSYYSQLWIDRNFALDYFLKSMMKIKTIEISEKIESIRFVYKNYSYWLLGMFLQVTLHRTDLLPEEFNRMYKRFIQSVCHNEEISETYKKILKIQFDLLQKKINTLLKDLYECLEDDEINEFKDIYNRWRKSDWKLIN